MKRIWDPGNRMNPHKVVDPYPIVSNMKLGTGYSPPEVETHFAFGEDGGSFAHAALRCVGAGKCRDDSQRDDVPELHGDPRRGAHDPRPRPDPLRDARGRHDHRRLPLRARCKEALDLCLSCKGCKGDCPVSVDMATYKAEFLSHHYKRRLRPLPAYSMGLIMFHARLAQHGAAAGQRADPRAGLSAALSSGPAASAPTARCRPSPTRPSRPGSSERGAVNPHGDPVVLFPDTFNNFLHPEPMKAAVEVLEAAGFRVVVPAQALCCGRPLYDYGMLDTAKLFWRRMLGVLAPHIRAGHPGGRGRAELRRRLPRRAAGPDARTTRTPSGSRCRR